jgi:hypothetical protein
MFFQAERHGQLSFIFTDETINERTQYRTDDRRSPEEPQLSNCPITSKYGYSGTTRRIYRRVSDGNADQVN